jgi:hypothetical protein
MVGLFIWVFFGVGAAALAAYRGYPYPISAMLGMLFGPIAFVVAMLLPPVGEGRRRAAEDDDVEREVNEAKDTFTCPECGRHNSVATRICPRCNHRFPT